MEQNEKTISVTVANKKNNLSNIIGFIVLSVIALAVLITSICLISFHAKGSGTITLEYINGETVITKEVKFKKDDKLPYLVKGSFKNVVIENGFVSSIEDYVTPADWSSFISILVDDKMSEVGIEQIEFTDGTKVTFKVTKYDPNYGN